MFSIMESYKNMAVSTLPTLLSLKWETLHIIVFKSMSIIYFSRSDLDLITVNFVVYIYFIYSFFHLQFGNPVLKFCSIKAIKGSLTFDTMNLVRNKSEKYRTTGVQMLMLSGYINMWSDMIKAFAETLLKFM